MLFPAIIMVCYNVYTSFFYFTCSLGNKLRINVWPPVYTCRSQVMLRGNAELELVNSMDPFSEGICFVRSGIRCWVWAEPFPECLCWRAPPWPQCQNDRTNE